MPKMRAFQVPDLGYVAVFAALIIVMGFLAIPIGGAGVPLVLQNAVIILTGLVLGPRRGGLAVALFLLLGMLGLPVLAGGRTTLAALVGPTAGYVVGYVFSAVVAGAIAYGAPQGAGPLRWLCGVVFALAAVGGLLTQYLFGAVGLYLRAGLDASEAILAQVPFFLPAAVEQSVMVVIALGVHAAFPDLRKRSRAASPAMRAGTVKTAS